MMDVYIVVKNVIGAKIVIAMTVFPHFYLRSKMFNTRMRKINFLVITNQDITRALVNQE